MAAFPAKIPLVDLRAQYDTIKDEVDRAIRETIESSSFILGERVSMFEEEFARYCGKKHCVSTSNGTSSLILALKAAGIGKGDEVITTPTTFIATAEAIILAGASIRFADADYRTCNMSAEKLKSAITEKTKAIIPVHLYGHPCDMDAIREIAESRGIKIVEDCAQAHGAEYKGQKVPAGETGCFSFYPAKILGAYGDAGAIVTNDGEIAEKARLLSNHGRRKGEKYVSEIEGSNERMDAMQAAILSVKLRHLDQWLEARRKKAARYTAELLNVETPYEESYAKPGYYMYVIKAERRDDMLNYLSQKGIGAQIHYPVPVHLQPAYKSKGWRTGSYPETERIANRVLSIPLYPELNEEQQGTVIKAINGFRQGGAH